MPLFNTNDTQHRIRNGQSCEIIRTITEADAEHDIECLPMQVVRFGDGVELEIFPDEIDASDPPDPAQHGGPLGDAGSDAQEPQTRQPEEQKLSVRGKGTDDRTTTPRSAVTLEQARQIYWFLQGTPIKGITCRNMPLLSRRAAFSVIYVLQEKFRLLPDTYEQCTRCSELFDTYEGGTCDEKTGRRYCVNCAK